jgi:hypothetical protein
MLMPAQILAKLVSCLLSKTNLLGFVSKMLLCRRAVIWQLKVAYELLPKILQTPVSLLFAFLPPPIH